ncbi:hypothetical protein PS862_04533 [Pseudomonas fluorescens]|uniref:MBL fold metallo-hydrolase n=1 Tax=Pseudomonas fluorescens TaxID=294 RepID=A0A5E7NCJ5_PSEFL|nr:MBL fold metallo-hydrolase [Pseudomonas fluorescens]VVP34207.1 hypothetical protein PS862_04533 [Pseudomonas fluorescens]
MRATFIGHQTWLIEHLDTKVLIDPLLCEDFGLVDQCRIDIYPPRTVDCRALADVDLIFLSHEHSDHFDIKSLNLLPRSAKFVVGATIVEPVKQCIRDLGFKLTEVNSTEPMRVKDLCLKFYPADPKTAFWESRVTQIYLEETLTPSAGVFIAVDALVSELYKSDIVEGKVLPPKLVVVSNNSRVSPPGAFQSLENWGKNTTASNRKTGPLGLGVLNSVLTTYLEDFPAQPEHVAMCGGGFIKRFDGFAAFPFSEQPMLSQLANQLSLDVNVIGLLPGGNVMLDAPSTVQAPIDWVKVDHIQHGLLVQELATFVDSKRSIDVASSVLSDFETLTQYQEALLRCEKELVRIAKSLMLFITGRKVIQMSHYRGKKLGSRRIVFSFRCNDLGLRHSYALNMVSGKFEVELDTDLDVLMADYPYGVCMPLVDFMGVVDGTIQIWDIVGVSIKSWFEHGIFDGLIPFFYSYYGGNGSPELLAKIIRRAMASVELKVCN